MAFYVFLRTKFTFLVLRLMSFGQVFPNTAALSKDESTVKLSVFVILNCMTVQQLISVVNRKICHCGVRPLVVIADLSEKTEKCFVSRKNGKHDRHFGLKCLSLSFSPCNSTSISVLYFSI